MNRKIVFYHRSSAVEHRMIQSLENGGFSICPATSPGALHNLFMKKIVPVVVVPLPVCKKYHIDVRSHLIEAKSPLAVICWIEKENGTIATRTISIGQESLDECLARENCGIARRVSLLIRSTGAPHGELFSEVNEGAAEYRSMTVLPHIQGIHQKMRQILEVIADSGTAGASPEKIIREIWPQTDRDRTHDLQSYISKLRKILAGTGTHPVNISYHNRVYRLEADK